MKSGSLSYSSTVLIFSTKLEFKCRSLMSCGGVKQELDENGSPNESDPHNPYIAEQNWNIQLPGGKQLHEIIRQKSDQSRNNNGADFMDTALEICDLDAGYLGDSQKHSDTTFFTVCKWNKRKFQ